MMEILVSKVLAILLLMTTSLVVGLLPAVLAGQFWFQSREVFRSTSKAVSVLSCFGGGVFMATCLLDLIPDVRRSVGIALEAAGIETEFPVADFIVSIGLFLILIVEQTALTFKHRDDVLAPHTHGHPDEATRLLKNSVVNDGTASQNYSAISPSSIESDGNVRPEGGELHCLDDEAAEHNTDKASQCTEENNDDDCHDLHSPSKMRSILLLCALSLHSVFEGLAMGVQETTQDVWTLFFAVIIHKSVLAFSLGVNFLKSGMGVGAVARSLLVFSVMAPIGITIGIIITQDKSFSQSIANGVIQGLATGTFLYITFFEVLPHEINTSRDRLLKVLALVLGFSLICTLVLLLPS